MKKLHLTCLLLLTLSTIKAQKEDEKIESLEQVTVAGNRDKISEKIRQSPITIERLDAKDLQMSATPTFYDAIGRLKGVTIVNNGLNSQSVNARGFNRFGNSLFIQLLDGMDTSTPSSNVSLANINGTNELDVASIEVVPGAASSLQSARAISGLINIIVKDPFIPTNQGVSAYTKVGFTRQDPERGLPLFTDNAFRIAKAWNDVIAFKLNVSYLTGSEFQAVDYTDSDADPGRINHMNQKLARANGYNPNNINKNPSYDGVNIYGDEYFYPLYFTYPARASRQGYKEVELFPDNKISNIKGDFGIYAKIFDNVTASYVLKIGQGDFQNQAQSRYMYRDYVSQMHKIQLEGSNWLVRTVYSEEDSGNSVGADVLGFGLNSYSRDGVNRRTSNWFIKYHGFFGLTQTPWGEVRGLDMKDSSVDHYTDITDFLKTRAESTLVNGQYVSNKLLPGTANFNNVLNTLKTKSFETDGSESIIGARYANTSSLNDNNAYYNFKNIFNRLNVNSLKELDVLVGGSYRAYQLRSNFQTFWDLPHNPIKTEEYSTYTQLTKRLLNGRLKLTASAMLSGNRDYDSNLSPSFAINYDLDAAKKHNIRLAYIEGIHYPENSISFLQVDRITDLYLGSNQRTLDQYRLLYFGLDYPSNVGYYDPNEPTTKLNNVYMSNGEINDLYASNIKGRNGKIGIDGNFILQNAYTAESYVNFLDRKDHNALVRANLSAIKPMQIKAVELSYKGSIGKYLDIDFNAYFNQLYNFSQPYSMYFETGYPNPWPRPIEILDFKKYTVYSSRTDLVTVKGFNLGINYLLNKRFKIITNYEYVDFIEGRTEEERTRESAEYNFRNGAIFYFNTPRHQVKTSFGTRGFSLMKKKLGFELNARWTDIVYFYTDFAAGWVPANTVIDASASYKINNHMILKAVGTNIMNHDYLVARGSAKIGSVYYLGLTINL